VEACVDTDITEVPDAVTDVGLNETDAPAGRPLTLNPTVPLKPLLGVTLKL